MLPVKLAKMLDEAIKSVLGHPKGELILPIRRQIWLLLGDYEVTDDDPVVQTIGLKRRTQLAVLCVEHVMPVWDAVSPTDQWPLELLKLIDDYLAGKIDEESLWKTKDKYWTDCDNLDERFSIAANVGYATIKVATTALVDQPLLGDHIEKDTLDEDLDAYDWDTSFWASGAYAGGGPWQDDSSIPKRREFWIWYLKKAVPQAYEAVR